MGLIFCCVRFSFFSLCFPMEKNRSNSFSISPGSIVPPPVFFLPVPAPFLPVPALFLPAALFCSFCAALALYSSLFCLSLRIRYASPISLNRSSARLSPGCIGGHSLPLFYMPFLWCPHQPFAKPLIPDMDSYLFQPFIHGNRKPVKCAFYCRFKAQAVLFADNLRPAVMLNNFLLPLQKRFCLSSV